MIKQNAIIPFDIVMSPSWWNKHVGITFDEDFFFNPNKRVESEQKMEQALYERWGKYGLGEDRKSSMPVIGAVHLASGFLLSEMLGCEVIYSAGSPPQVICANKATLDISVDDAFSSDVFKKFTDMTESLKDRFGFLVGDVNWSGILNLALDLRGEMIFMDMYDKPQEVKNYFNQLKSFVNRFVTGVQKQTGTSSISVNRLVRHLDEPVYLHSECSNTMISVEDYDKFLFPIDSEWSLRNRPFGIHYCGMDPDRFAESFALLPHLDFLDVGWGGDVKKLRQHLPGTFLNIRLSPVNILRQTKQEIHDTVCMLVEDSGDPYLTGVCCINMDENVKDEQINAIFETISKLRSDNK